MCPNIWRHSSPLEVVSPPEVMVIDIGGVTEELPKYIGPIQFDDGTDELFEATTPVESKNDEVITFGGHRASMNLVHDQARKSATIIVVLDPKMLLEFIYRSMITK